MLSRPGLRDDQIDGRSKKEATRQLEESRNDCRWNASTWCSITRSIASKIHIGYLTKRGTCRTSSILGSQRVALHCLTGHKDPRIHLYMLEVAAATGFKFDAVQMPLNLMDAHFRSFAKHVLPELVRQNIGVLGMKSMANGILLTSNTVTPVECLHYALNLPTSVVITGIDSMEILDQALTAVRTFQPLSDHEIEALLARTAKAAARGEFEPFKTTSLFDATATNPEWLGEEPQRLQQLMP